MLLAKVIDNLLLAGEVETMENFLKHITDNFLGKQNYNWL